MRLCSFPLPALLSSPTHHFFSKTSTSCLTVIYHHISRESVNSQPTAWFSSIFFCTSCLNITIASTVLSLSTNPNCFGAIVITARIIISATSCLYHFFCYFRPCSNSFIPMLFAHYRMSPFFLNIVTNTFFFKSAAIISSIHASLSYSVIHFTRSSPPAFVMALLASQMPEFHIKVRHHQGPSLCSFLVVITLDFLSEHLEAEDMCQLLFADGFAILENSEHQLQEMIQS